MQTPTMRLSMSKDYVRPTKTMTDRMQNKDELKKFLKDYEEVDAEDVNFLPLGQLLRYISYDKRTKREIFRYGGLLKKIAKEYMVLQGKNGMTFSAQRFTFDDAGNLLHTTRFFKKRDMGMTSNHVKDFEEALERSNTLIEKQMSIIEQQKKELIQLKKEMDQNKKKSK